MDVVRPFVIFIAMVAVGACGNGDAGSGPAITEPPPQSATVTPPATSSPSTTPAPSRTASTTPVPTPTAAGEQFSVTITGGTVSATLQVTVANTEAERARGLMGRTSMPENVGMLFLFPRDSRTGFWMEGTPLPLTIAYIGADGTVQELRDGKPYDRTVLTPAAAYRYVIEVNQGWFGRQGLGVGAKAILPDGLPKAQ